MAKKIRRARLSATQTYEPIAQPGIVAEPQLPKSAGSREVNFQEEYRYIISDLQRIGILAAVVLGGLGILSFFIK
jgi:hypothetical protein